MIENSSLRFISSLIKNLKTWRIVWSDCWRLDNCLEIVIDISKILLFISAYDCVWVSTELNDLKVERTCYWIVWIYNDI
jgi:hypothetical protein